MVGGAWTPGWAAGLGVPGHLLNSGRRDGVPGGEVTSCRPRDDPAVWSLGTGWLKEARTVKRHENHNKLCTLARQQLGAVAGPGLLVSKTESTM